MVAGVVVVVGAEVVAEVVVVVGAGVEVEVMRGVVLLLVGAGVVLVVVVPAGCCGYRGGLVFKAHGLLYHST